MAKPSSIRSRSVLFKALMVGAVSITPVAPAFPQMAVGMRACTPARLNAAPSCGEVKPSGAPRGATGTAGPTGALVHSDDMPQTVPGDLFACVLAFIGLYFAAADYLAGLDLISRRVRQIQNEWGHGAGLPGTHGESA